MALRIIRAAEPIHVERLNVCIYGPPGVGKTTLAFTADTPLLLDFDAGAHRAKGRKDVVQVSRWDDVASISADDLAPYRTVIVDTAGRAVDALGQHLMRKDSKLGQGGILNIKGFGALKMAFQQWLSHLNSSGLDVVLIAHMEEVRKGDDTLERLDVQGGSKSEIYKSADMMGRLVVNQRGRVLLFDPSDTAFGKNPGQLEPQPVPLPDRAPLFLAGLIAEAKARLNALTAEQAQAQAQVAEWQAKVSGFAGAEDFNAVLPQMRSAPETVRHIVAQAAKARRLTFDRASGLYQEAAA